MFARLITLVPKPNMVDEFKATLEKEILPLLRKQKGFVDELVLVTPERKEMLAISLWENKDYAEIYNKEAFPQVEKIIGKFIETVPVVKRYDTEFSTFHKIAFAATV